MKKPAILLLLATLLALPVTPALAAPAHSARDAVVTSPADGTEIAVTVFRPAGASAAKKVPVILHSHGWAGSRTTTIDGAVRAFLDAGFGVVSIDQRGHGDSGGQAHVQDPTRETEDIQAVIDHIAGLAWVRHDRTAAGFAAKDPVLGAIGGSYGGGYQTMTALDEIAETGHTRFNALAPEITWFDLPESLAPQGVVRTEWNALLYGAGARMVPQYIHEAFAWGTATGQWPDGTLYGESADRVPDIDSEFHRHSPVSFVERGIRIDVPVLLRQGTSDNLFNLNQGLHIFDKAVTAKARSHSYFVGYNGGHALPSLFPPGTATGGDACSGDFTKLTIAFFKRVFSGRSTAGLLPSRYNLTTADGAECLSYPNLSRGAPLGIGGPNGLEVTTTTGAGRPQQVALMDGPVLLGGIPTLSGTVTSIGVDQRAFFGLSIGTSPSDAMLIQNNVMPLRLAQPVQDRRFRIELPGVAIEVPKGQTLFLTLTPVSDASFGHGSRTPGAMVVGDLHIALPTRFPAG